MTTPTIPVAAPLASAHGDERREGVVGPVRRAAPVPDQRGTGERQEPAHEQRCLAQFRGEDHRLEAGDEPGETEALEPAEIVTLRGDQRLQADPQEQGGREDPGHRGGAELQQRGERPEEQEDHRRVEVGAPEPALLGPAVERFALVPALDRGVVRAEVAESEVRGELEVRAQPPVDERVRQQGDEDDCGEEDEHWPLAPACPQSPQQ
nr:hypothetical protein [Halosimplex aquaticum]